MPTGRREHRAAAGLAGDLADSVRSLFRGDARLAHGDHFATVDRGILNDFEHDPLADHESDGALLERFPASRATIGALWLTEAHAVTDK